jgi:hypothetical protein
MLQYLTFPLLKLIGQPLLPQKQESSRLVYHHTKICDSVNHHVRRGFAGCGGRIVHIDANGKIEPDTVVHVSLRSRRDWIGLSSWSGELYLLASNGQLYNSLGELVSNDCVFLSSNNHGSHLTIRMTPGEFRSYASIDDLRNNINALNRIPLPSDADAVSVGGLDMPMYTKNGTGYMRWIENEYALTHHRNWITCLKGVPKHSDGYDVMYEASTTGRKPYWGCILDQSCTGVSSSAKTVLQE